MHVRDGTGMQVLRSYAGIQTLWRCAAHTGRRVEGRIRRAPVRIIPIRILHVRLPPWRVRIISTVIGLRVSIVRSSRLRHWRRGTDLRIGYMAGRCQGGAPLLTVLLCAVIILYSHAAKSKREIVIDNRRFITSTGVVSTRPKRLRWCGRRCVPGSARIFSKADIVSLRGELSGFRSCRSVVLTAIIWCKTLELKIHIIPRTILGPEKAAA